MAKKAIVPKAIKSTQEFWLAPGQSLSDLISTPGDDEFWMTPRSHDPIILTGTLSEESSRILNEIIQGAKKKIEDFESRYPQTKSAN